MEAELTINFHGQSSSRHTLRLGQQLELGRTGVNAEDLKISRRHARVELRPDGIHVTDLHSSNGTFLDGVRLSPGRPTLVPPGKPIGLGSHVVTVRVQPGAQNNDLLEVLRAHLPADEFEILGEIGTGSVGSVWAARQPFLDRTVAIKVLRDEVELSQEDQKRFVREGRLCALVQSPYVVQLYDVRIAAGRPMMIMELVPGPSAMECIKKDGAFPIPEALRIGVHVARALTATSLVEVVHRDVRPHNVLLDSSGTAKLSDFGIAKHLGASLHHTPLTDPNMLVLGTLPFVAPEQARDPLGVDVRADLYGLGVTLYHMISGHPPFVFMKSHSPMRCIDQILNVAPPPLSRFRPNIPKPLEAYIQMLLEKDPAARPGPAADVASTLRDMRAEYYPEHGRPPNPALEETTADE